MTPPTTHRRHRPDPGAPPRRLPGLGRVGRRHRGLRARRLPPHLARGRRSRRRRALPHQLGPARDVHHGPAVRLRRDADPGRRRPGPGRLQEDAGHGRHPDDVRPARLRLRGHVRGGRRGPRLRRHGRRHDLHQPAAARGAVVPAGPDRDDHPDHGGAGSAGRHRVRGAAGAGPHGVGLDPLLRHRRRGRGRPRRRARPRRPRLAVRQPPPRGPQDERRRPRAAARLG